MTAEQIKFLNALRWTSITLSDWAKKEFENGRTMEEVHFFLNRGAKWSNDFNTK